MTSDRLETLRAQFRAELTDEEIGRMSRYDWHCQEVYAKLREALRRTTADAAMDAIGDTLGPPILGDELAEKLRAVLAQAEDLAVSGEPA